MQTQARAGRGGLTSEATFAGAVIMMVVMLVVPLPSALLSVLISANLAAALVVLLVTMYTTEPLDFAVFPTLLLITTLFRLALNVSTTRLILLDGYAGGVVQAFGEFVVGGNPLVGFIVFLILIIIQFVVITRGAERVAEVAARFTLDAMPGKQMSIDADLNAGLIDDKEARRRRRDIEREADFYGAMDGASKFVKGDAMAALMIIAINILGGFVIGMVQKHMGFSEALQRYTLLTVGDGLSSQIPALLISTATGIVVTRAAAQDTLGREVVGELLAQPRVFYIAGGFLVALGIVPGMPRLPFLILGGLLLWLGRVRTRAQQAATPASSAPAAGAGSAPSAPEQVIGLVEYDPLEIELGFGLLKLAEGPTGGELMERVGLIRRQIALDMGLVLPLVRVRDNIQLGPNAYTVQLRGGEVGRGELYLDRFLVMDPGGVAEPVPGLETKEPAFGLPARWIASGDRTRAELAGYTVVDPATVLATHFSELCKRNAAEILTRQETKALLDLVRQKQPALVDDLVPAVLSTGQVQKVLQNLLREGVRIRNLTTILEALAEHAPANREPEVLTEQVRAALAREITRDLPVDNGRLPVITVDPAFERQLVEGGAPGQLRELRRSLNAGIERAAARGTAPVVLTSPPVRAAFRRLIERLWPAVKVISTAELAGDLEIETLAVLGS